MFQGRVYVCFHWAGEISRMACSTEQSVQTQEEIFTDCSRSPRKRTRVTMSSSRDMPRNNVPDFAEAVCVWTSSAHPQQR